jgi:serine protease AprX
MKTQGYSYTLRAVMAVVIIGLLFSLTSAVVPAPAAQKQQSYIVQAATTSLAAQLVEKYAGTVTSRLEIIHAVGALLTSQAVAELRLEKGILAITPNGSIKSSGNGIPGNTDQDKVKGVPVTDYPNVVGADIVWQNGVTGAGVTVAILDTGIDNLTALAKSTDNKQSRIVAWQDFIEGSNKPIDPNGHGSHVAGIIANSDKGADDEWNGVAPGVNLAGVRVLDQFGVGTYETVISGLQWVLQNKALYNIRIVNLSLVAPVQSPYWADPLDQAVTQVWANGVTVIAAAGNGGPGAMSISVPGNNPYVVTVGAFTDNYTPADWNDDYITPFSAAGPTLDGFVKPDLVAPGGHIISVVPTNSNLVTQYPANWIKKTYFQLAGTSQATAIVSGVAALIIAKNPALTPDEVKARLTNSALPWVDAATTNALYSMWQQGAGRVNAPDAVFAEMTGSANQDMDIQADLAGTIHYEGFTYYDDATGTFHLYDPYSDWAGGYGSWDGSYGSWTGGHGSWSGGHGSWSGGHGSWSGGIDGTWAGGHGSWSGGHGSWSGGHGSWSGGYSTWSGGHGSWSGSEPWSGSQFMDPAFVSSFLAGATPDVTISKATTSFFLQDP